ncbi:MAG: C69 family dipeptidase [Bacilli bacterium]|jgi:dipeptidase|nr:C69 family dipeptidase [Bacilli bacterium]
MACTTILVGKKASYDGSTIIARNDDSPSGQFHAKKLAVIQPKDQPRHYKSVISHVEIDLPDNPLRYTSMPNVDKSEGIWAAAGVNEANVSMTATETITSNPRVLGGDPYVNYVAGKGNQKEVKGGIGEEELVVLVLPYIHTAREGVLRLGSLLEQFGTYEPNGIAFSDQDEIWWLETIGGHHWIARKVLDEEYVVMPNQFGMDRFDLNDAFQAKENNLCSADLKDFIAKNHLMLDLKGKLNPREAFGSHDDSDHVYNTPRAWFIERYFNPRTIKWEGEEADYTPESDDIPWSLVPERKITIEDVKYVLSSHYQGTPYDPYSKVNYPEKGKYRPIGISRTSFLSVSQIRPYVKNEYAALEWIAFGSNVFNALIPLYANMVQVPEYFGNTLLKVSSENFYWASRIIGALADPHFGMVGMLIERYQNATAARAHELINKYDEELIKSKETALTIKEANEDLAKMAQEETDKALDKVLYAVSCLMKNGYNRSDN